MKIQKSKAIVIALCAVAMGLASCKKPADLTDSMLGISLTKIPNTYSRTVVDTDNLSTTIYEYTLEGADTHKGTYVVTCFDGKKGTCTTTSQNILWERGNYDETNMFFDMDLRFPDAVHHVKWGSASIVDENGLVHDGPARAANVVKISESLPRVWTARMVDLWIDNDTIDYIKFTQTIDRKMTQARIDEINAYLQTPEMEAAIALFNSRFVQKGQPLAVDYVEIIKDNGDGTFITRYFKDSKAKKTEPDTLGVKSLLEMELEFRMVAGVPNVAAISRHSEEYSKQYYRPGLPTDSLNSCVIEDRNLALNGWGIGFNGTLLNAKNLSIFGAQDGTINRIDSVGTPDGFKGYSTPVEVAPFATYLVSGLEVKKNSKTGLMEGTITFDGDKLTWTESED